MDEDKKVDVFREMAAGLILQHTPEYLAGKKLTLDDVTLIVRSAFEAGVLTTKALYDSGRVYGQLDLRNIPENKFFKV